MTYHMTLFLDRKWKQEQTEMLAQKDAEEQTNLEELKVQARNELAEWYARHEEQLNQTKTLNRSVALCVISDNLHITLEFLKIFVHLHNFYVFGL